MGWLQVDVSVREAWGQAVAAYEEGKRAADLAATAHEVAFKDAEAAKERCRAAEAARHELDGRRRGQVREGLH